MAERRNEVMAGRRIDSKEAFLKCSVQSLSCVRLLETPWTTAGQASLSITNSQRLLKLMSVESWMTSKICLYTLENFNRQGKTDNAAKIGQLL